MHFNLPQLLESLGSLAYFVVWGIIFAESGLFIGFFLPGDSLLFTAGFIAYTKPELMNIWVLIFGAFVCAVIGDNVGYFSGHKFGRKLFQKEPYKKHLVKTQDFYEKHGKKTIVLARFVPIVRTFAPIIAGVGAMHYRTFMFYNLIGGFIWTFGITLLGYFLGKSLPAEQVDKYLLPIIGLIILVSLIPSIIHIIQESRGRKD
ncbi:VTT domain-containing protein [Plectonema radiosum NIES-515]|uniref:VTT domain-containing protein n=1 Tax=Plectonema radiosum NIES-515 TaxID=2986073 RepID=A0ABT3AZ49_9CYAN|nr:VTT domain-containing protein [Plectonema radiosum]MCV3214403.1 VTT domain-containing protein [Plectonema radiosum NIES-515]